MSQFSKTLPFDIAQFSLSEAARKTVGIDFELQPAHYTSLIKYGTWCILPVAKRFPFLKIFGQEVVGVRLLPNRSILESPVVICSGNQIITASTTLASAIPMLIYRYSLYEQPKRWKIICDRWSQIEDELIALHSALGGHDRLKGIRSLLFDEQIYSQSNQPNAFQESVRESLDILDQSPEHLLYRKYVHQAILTHTATIPLPKGFGCWTNAAKIIAFQANLSRKYDIEFPLLAAWEVVNMPASVDTGTTREIQHLFRSGGNADLRIYKAVEFLYQYQDKVPTEWQEDPIWKATMMLAEHGQNYNGIAHIETAKHLDEQGQPERAFDALISAAFWSYNYQGKALNTTIEAAYYLASKYGWEEIYAILDQLMIYYNEQI